MKIRTPNGELLEVEDIDFNAEKEEWNIYKLSDGTTLKFKTIIRNIYRTDKYDQPTGDPIYHVTSTSVVSVLVPPNLKQHSKKVDKQDGMEVS